MLHFDQLKQGLTPMLKKWYHVNYFNIGRLFKVMNYYFPPLSHTLTLFLILPGGILSGFKLTQRAQCWIEGLWTCCNPGWPPCRTHLRPAHTWGKHTFTNTASLSDPWGVESAPCRAFLSRLDRPCVSTPAGQKIVVSNPLSIQNPFFPFPPLSVCLSVSVAVLPRESAGLRGNGADQGARQIVCGCVCMCEVCIWCAYPPDIPL